MKKINEKKMRNMLKVFVVLAMAVVPMFLSVSAYADDSKVATINLKDLIVRSAQPYIPVIEQNHLSLKMEAEMNYAFYGSPEDVREKFSLIFGNALVNAPQSGEVIVGFDEGSKTLYARVPKDSVRFTMEREVEDINGTKFLIKTEAGQYTLYSVKL